MNAETFADDLRNKQILITGASGLICSSFIDLLIRYNEQGAHISIYAMSRMRSMRINALMLIGITLCLPLSVTM